MAKKLLEKISGKKIIVTKTHKRTQFGGAKGRPIGVKVTIRGKEAEQFVRDALKANENIISPDQFDTSGNFSLGIKEYIDLPGIKYDPDIEIIGMDVCITLTRPGYRVKKKRIKPAKIGLKHRITQEEAREWVKKKFDVKISKEEDE